MSKARHRKDPGRPQPATMAELFSTIPGALTGAELKASLERCRAGSPHPGIDDAHRATIDRALATLARPLYVDFFARTHMSFRTDAQGGATVFRVDDELWGAELGVVGCYPHIRGSLEQVLEQLVRKWSAARERIERLHGGRGPAEIGWPWGPHPSGGTLEGMTSWAGFRTYRENASRNGPRIDVDVVLPTGGGEPSADQWRTGEWLIERESQIHAALVEALLQLYRKSYRTWDDELPDYRKIERFKDRELHEPGCTIHAVARRGVSYVGFELAAEFEGEHRLGVLMFGEKVVKIGYSEIATSRPGPRRRSVFERPPYVKARPR